MYVAGVVYLSCMGQVFVHADAGLCSMHGCCCAHMPPDLDLMQHHMNSLHSYREQLDWLRLFSFLACFGLLFACHWLPKWAKLPM
ncbi:hypothetical protein COO60DRAFT_215356 [Scenedesmus sp. NREL 46B-D3]|nr:hypothetical protein COO60DRAFT_215356 [Scenedesmus sp. NREL 46B-D3]